MKKLLLCIFICICLTLLFACESLTSSISDSVNKAITGTVSSVTDSVTSSITGAVDSTMGSISNAITGTVDSTIEGLANAFTLSTGTGGSAGFDVSSDPNKRTITLTFTGESLESGESMVIVYQFNKTGTSIQSGMYIMTFSSAEKTAEAVRTYKDQGYTVNANGYTVTIQLTLEDEDLAALTGITQDELAMALQLGAAMLPSLK